MKNRTCCLCGVSIKECMGFVLARDFINNEKIPREICALCGFKALFIPDQIIQNIETNQAS
jgi:hypothetical protein